jgi:hypothetical protein
MATRREEELRTSRESREFRAWWDRFYGTRSLNPQPYVVRRAAWHAWATVREKQESSGDHLCPGCLEQVRANEIENGTTEKLDKVTEREAAREAERRQALEPPPVKRPVGRPRKGSMADAVFGPI